MWNELLKNKTALAFAGGVATGLIAVVVMESDVFKEISSKALADLKSFKSELEDIPFEVDNDVEEVNYTEKD